MIIKKHKHFIRDKISNGVILYGLFILSIVFGAGTIGLLTARNALAASTNTWTGAAGDKLWSTANNWSLGHTPASDEAVSIDASVDTTISVSQDITVASIKVGETSSHAVTLDMSTNKITAGAIDFENSAVLSTSSIQAESINLVGGSIRLNYISSGNGIHANGDITLSNSSTINYLSDSSQSFPINAASLNVGPGSTVQNGNGSFSQITISGAITNAGSIPFGSIQTGSLTNSGNIMGSSSSGSLVVNSDLNNSSSIGNTSIATITVHGNFNNTSASVVVQTLGLHVDGNFIHYGTIVIGSGGLSVNGYLTDYGHIVSSSNPGNIDIGGNVELDSTAGLNIATNTHIGGTLTLNSRSTVSTNNLTVEKSVLVDNQSQIISSNNITIKETLLNKNSNVVSENYNSTAGTITVIGNVTNDTTATIATVTLTVGGSLTSEAKSTLYASNIDVSGQFDNINSVITNSNQTKVGGDLNVTVNDGLSHNITFNNLSALHNLNFTNCSKVSLGGSTVVSGDMYISSSTVSVSGDLSASNLTNINNSNTQIIAEEGTNTIRKDFNNDSTSLFKVYDNLVVGGNFINKNNSDGEVSLYGTTTLSGDNDDNINVEGSNKFTTLIISPGKTVTLEAGSTQTIYNDLEANGSTGQLIKIRSSVTGQQANLDIQGIYNISYVDVQDGNNLLGAYLEPENSIDSGDNTYWFANTYKVTTSVSNGGSITSDQALTNILTGNNRLMKITPSAGYKIVNVTVDSVAQGAIDHYVFTDIRQNHSISATFAIAGVTMGNNQTTTPLTTTAAATINTSANTTAAAATTSSSITKDNNTTTSASSSQTSSKTDNQNKTESAKTTPSTPRIVVVTALSVFSIIALVAIIRKALPLIVAIITK